MPANSSTTKVLIIIPNLGRGGAQQVFRQQLKYLSQQFEVTGCVFNWDGAFPEDHQDTIVSLSVSAGSNYLYKMFYFLLRVVRLRKLKRKLSIDVTISHLEGADYMNVLSRAKDKIVCWIHGTKEFDENISGWLGYLRMNIFIPFLYRRSDQLITVSNGIQQELLKNLSGVSGKVKTIYNGFDVGEICSLSNIPLEEPHDSLFKDFNIIITHCRLSRQKNLESLLLIYQRIRRLENVKLVIVGDGELRESLLSFAQQLELAVWSCWDHQEIDFLADVYFIGQQRNPFKFLRRAKVYIMTSNWEGFPLSLGEALACGLQVISADCYTGPREIIAPGIELQQPLQVPFQGKYGILMPLADRSSNDSILLWASELQRISSEIESVSGRKQAEAQEGVNKFAISETVKQTIDVVKQIV